MRKSFFTIMVLFVSFSTYGQISTDEEPISFERSVTALTRNGNTEKVLPPLDMETIRQEDIEDEANGMPPRFGYKHEVDYNLYNSGEWIVLSDSSKLWRLSISCPDALSINLLYDQFWLPEGAKFFVYNPDSRDCIGAMTSINNKGERDNIQGFATGLIYGDQVILEYYVPNEVSDTGVISIAYVVHGYRYIILGEERGRDYGESAPCNININCWQGNKWKYERNAVAMIVAGGNRICTGSLINTTACDNRPYFLTALHCMDNYAPSALAYWTFYWHYESPSCTSSDPGLRPVRYSTSGATILAKNPDSDFLLLKLTEDPRSKNNVTPYYLGWDRSENPGTSGGVGIHHPAGDIKKISQANNIQNCSYQLSGNHGVYPPNTQWIATFYNGFIEGGSSGSPFINNNRKVVGQATAVPQNMVLCDTPYIAYYGKLCVSWDGASSSVRLRDWLDPLQTEAMILNGTFECSGTKNFSNQTYNSGQSTTEKDHCVINITNNIYNNGSSAKYYAGDVIRLKTGTKAKKGSNVLFVALGGCGYTRETSMLSASPNTNETNEINSSLNNMSETAEIEEVNEANIYSKDSLQKNSSQNDLQAEEEKNQIKEIQLHPNPNNGTFTITTNFAPQEILSIRVFNPVGLSVYQQAGLPSNTIQLPSVANGMYWVEVITQTQRFIRKMVVQ